jgi:hypothetical protein
MAGADKHAKEAMPVNVAAEVANTPPPEAIARFPILARCGIEMRRQITEVSVDVLAAIGLCKKAAEGGVVRQVLKRCDL